MNMSCNITRALLLVGLCSGCGTVEPTYKPTRVGSLGDGRVQSGMAVVLLPDQHRAKIGDMLAFTVIMRNVGSDAVWFPTEPDVLLTWVYPDGKRDNFVRDQGEKPQYHKQDLVYLKPGQEILYRIAIATYYFDHGGITEFRALLRVASPHPPNLEPFWTGKIESNGFGVLMEKKGRESAIRVAQR